MLKGKRTLLLVLTIVLATILASGVAYAATRVGTEDDDTIKGTRKGDKIYGLGGNDTINSGRGYDQVYAGAGNDTVHGGKTYDHLHGEDGCDTLYGDSGGDIINTEWPRAVGCDGGTEYAYGGSNDDWIEADEGAYTEAYGEDGDDEIYVADWTSSGGAPDYVDCGPGTDIVHYDSQDTIVNCEAKIPE